MTGRPRVIIVYRPGADLPLQVVTGIYGWIADHDTWDVVHLVNDDRAAADVEAMDSVDGAIIIGPSSHTESLLKRPGLPCVVVLGDPLDPFRPLVAVDEDQLCNDALDEFASLGVPRVATMAYNPTRRTHTFADAAALRKLPCASFGVAHEESAKFWPQRHAILADWLLSLETPVGVLAHASPMARDLAAAAQMAGLSVPDDVVIISVEGDEVHCRACLPPLTAMRVDAERMGRISAGLLSRRMKGEKVDERVLIPPTGVDRRESSDVLNIPDPQLSRAIRTLRDVATDESPIEITLKDAGVSRSQLEYGMRRYLGRTPYEEVMRVRLEKACDLLRDSSLELSAVAETSGFGTLSNFCKVFKRRLQVTPRDYRLGRELPEVAASN